MSNPPNYMTFVRKAGTKLDGASNFKAWKKRIDPVLKENEVMQFVEGNVPVPDKNDAQEVAKYYKGEIRVQKIV